MGTDGETGRGTRQAKRSYVTYGKIRNRRPNVAGVSIKTRNGAPSRKGRVVNGQMTEASNKMSTPPPFLNPA